MNQRKVTSSVAPDLFTVEEAARVLRIGRTTAYELARRYLRSNGAEGIAVLRVGHLLRVPRCGLEEFVGGPITWRISDELVTATAPAPITAIDARSHSTRRRRSSSSQQSLPPAVVGPQDVNYPSSHSTLPDV